MSQLALESQVLRQRAAPFQLAHELPEPRPSQYVDSWHLSIFEVCQWDRSNSSGSGTDTSSLSADAWVYSRYASVIRVPQVVSESNADVLVRRLGDQC
jgi:hypothetical protein